MRSSGRVDQQPLCAGGEVLAATLDDGCGRGRDVGRLVRRQVKRLPGGPAGRRDIGRGLRS
jgi:hypothetical protein